MERIHDLLVETAREGKVIQYGDLSHITGISLMGRGRSRLSSLLQACCKGEIDDGRPMLGSVVVRKDTGMPGDGYFRVASKLGRFTGGTEPAKRAFWSEELQRVYDYWSSH